MRPSRVSSWLVAAAIVGGLAASLQARRSITIKVAARAFQPGELVVLTIETTQTADFVKVQVFDRDLSAFSIDPSTWRVLVGIDLATPAGTYPVAVEALSAGRKDRAQHTLIITPKAFPTRTLTVDDAFVNPPAAMEDRIAAEARLLEGLWTSGSTTKLWTGAFVRPVPDEANSAFGSRSVFNGQPKNPHSGADFRSPAGRPVKAPNAGRVALARDLYYSGQTVVIDHGLGVFSLFAHLSAIDVKEGADVHASDVVGRVGATGRVTGAHLHWAMRVGGARIDPLSLLATLGK